MGPSRRDVALRQLLDACDDLRRLRGRLAEDGLARDARTRVRRQLRTKSAQLERNFTSYRFRGPLGDTLRECRLDAVHFQLLATLLHRHLSSETPGLEGRLLLSAVFENSFDVLVGTEILHENGVLRTSGLLVLEDDEGLADDVLEARFRLSDDALGAFRDEVSGVVVAGRRTPSHGYATNHEVLVDLRFLHNLYKHRSERVFLQDRWDRVHPGQTPATGPLDRRIDAAWKRLERRLTNTADAARLPAVRFFRDHDLERSETILVVHLLFRELYEGNAYADAAELVRLVSRDELDLVRSRRLVLESGRLRQLEILEVEPLLEGRSLTGEAHLADWAVNYLFGASPDETAIGSDDRLDWHLYLKKLEDTGSFFRDLEAN